MREIYITETNQLSFELGIDIHWIETCTSTNQVAKQLADDGWSGVLVTEYQTQGRGRMERSWLSNPGENLLLSWAFECRCKVQELPRIPLLLAGELAHAFDLFVKWPNDIVTKNGCKVGGVLSTVSGLEENVWTVVIGLGLNVNQTEFADELKASSLRIETQRIWDRLAVLKKVVEVCQGLDISQSFERWSARSITLGRTVEMAGRIGMASGIREDGALIVDGKPITSGDVHLVEM